MTPHHFCETIRGGTLLSVGAIRPLCRKIQKMLFYITNFIKKKDGKNGGGFTLIETIFALAILVIGITGVLMMFAAGTKSQHLAGMETAAVFLAQAGLEETVSRSYSEIDSGVEDYGKIWGFENYKRETEVVFWNPIDSASSQTDTGMKKIKVTVFWDADQKRYELASFISYQ